MQALAIAIAELDRPTFVPAFRTWLHQVIAHDNVALLAYYHDRRPSLIFAHSRTPEVHADLGKGYLDGAYLLDPFYDLHVTGASEGMYRFSDVVPDQFSRNRYFIEYYRKTTMVDEIAIVCHPNPGVSVQLCLGRDRETNRPYLKRELASARDAVPVIIALLRRQWSDLRTFGAPDGNAARDLLIAKAKDVLGISLTLRESEIILLVLKGHSSASIGLRLDISYQTVKVFRRQIYRKAGISSQAELFSRFAPLLRE
jgi:DNA-binding CsgD family transcriptional regulator